MTCLLGVPITVGVLPPEVLRQYAEAAGRVPRRYWGLILAVEIGEHNSTGKAHRDGRIRIPSDFHAGQLWHEAGHIASWADDDRILNAFSAKFWPNGKPKGRPSSDYGARQGAAEDCAETFRRLWRGDRGTARIEWLRGRTCAL